MRRSELFRPPGVRRSIAWIGVGSLVVGLWVIPASGEICQVDLAPAATLLLPYFEVDLGPAGPRVDLEIFNLADHPVLVNVTIWTDLSVPVISFPVYLTGFDAQALSLHSILTGNLPQTAPNPLVSPVGPNSSGAPPADFDPASCEQLPFPPLPSQFRQWIQEALRGQPSGLWGGQCGGQLFGDGRLRGYVTIDTVRRCTFLYPSDPGYFGPGGEATDQNVLTGRWRMYDTTLNEGWGDSLVHIEADPGFGFGDYTFYGRYVGWTGDDHREPLARAMIVGYFNLGAFGATDLIAWRDSKVVQGPFPCQAVPAWYPLAQNEILAYDEKENPLPLNTVANSPAPGGVPTPFAAEAQLTPFGGPTLPIPFATGWLKLSLDTTIPAAAPLPPNLIGVGQGWVFGADKLPGALALGAPALPLASACNQNLVLNPAQP